MEKNEVSEMKKSLLLSRQKHQRINGVDVRSHEYEELLLKQQMLDNSQYEPYKLPNYDPNKEKWIDLDGTKNFYLRLIYGTKNPITDINFYYIAQKNNENRIAVPAKEKMELVKVSRHDGVGKDVQFSRVLQKAKVPEKNAIIFHGVYDLKYYLDRQELSNTPKAGLASPNNTNKALCLAIKRMKNEQPVYDVHIIQSKGNKR